MRKEKYNTHGSQRAIGIGPRNRTPFAAAARRLPPASFTGRPCFARSSCPSVASTWALPSKYDSKERGIISAAYARGPFFSKCTASFLRNFNIYLKKLTIAISAPLPSKSLTCREIPKKYETSTHVCKFFCHARLLNRIGLERSKKQNVFKQMGNTGIV